MAVTNDMHFVREMEFYGKIHSSITNMVLVKVLRTCFGHVVKSYILLHILKTKVCEGECLVLLHGKTTKTSFEVDKLIIHIPGVHTFGQTLSR